ncbi:MAG: hypothetical protein NTW87_10615 [Planctomycetota bacterium]|nr:hypothetical protein [Planctomycetota bacterium]
MIEINLLPEELVPEPILSPPRMAVILAGVLVAGGLSFLIGKYYLVKIPVMDGEIKNRDAEIKNYKEQEKEVKEIERKLTTLQSKVDTLTNLMRSRIRYARLMDSLCNAVPEGVWFRSFNVRVGGSDSGTGQTPLGKRYTIALTGFIIGKDGLEREDRFKKLMDKLDEWFVKAYPDPSKNGVNTFLGARFDKPRLISKVVAKVPPPKEKDERLNKAMDVPEDGLDFSMTLSFEVPQKAPGT